MAIFPSGYSFEIDKTEKKEWMTALNSFKDATLQQSWNYLENLSGIAKPVRVVLKNENKIISMAQGKIIKLPFLPFGIAHFIHAPVWKIDNTSDDQNILQYMLKFMRLEFVKNRRLLLSIRSYEKNGFTQGSPINSTFEEEGFELQPKPFYRTILINLSPSLEDLRKNLKAKWRRNLSKSERAGLKLSLGGTDAFYQTFRELHYEMFRRKHPEKWYNPDIDKDWNLIKSVCTEDNRAVLIAFYEGKPVAALMIVAIGNTGMNFFSATGDLVVKEKLHALYFLQWQAMVWLKENGYTYYDMRGYDPERFPGVSYFKSGLGGEDTRYAEYINCDSKLNQLFLSYGETIILNFNLKIIALKENNLITKLNTFLSKFPSKS